KSGKAVNTPGVARIMITLQFIRALFLRPLQQGVAILPEIKAGYRVTAAVRHARNPGPDNTPDSGQGRELWRDLGEAGGTWPAVFTRGMEANDPRRSIECADHAYDPAVLAEVGCGFYPAAGEVEVGRPPGAENLERIQTPGRAIDAAVGGVRCG